MSNRDRLYVNQHPWLTLAAFVAGAAIAGLGIGVLSYFLSGGHP